MNTDKINELARLYELAGHEKEKAELESALRAKESELKGSGKERHEKEIATLEAKLKAAHKEHEHEKAELLGRILGLEGKNAELRTLANRHTEAIQRQADISKLEHKTNVSVPDTVSSSLNELKGLLKRKGIDAYWDVFWGQYFIVPYLALNNDDLRISMYEHSRVLIGVVVANLKSARDRDKIRRLAVCEFMSGTKPITNLPEFLAGYPNLYMLSFYSIYVGGAEAQALAGSTHIRNLTHLGFPFGKVGDVGARAIANSEHMGRLTYLDLGSNDIGDAGAQAIARSEHMARLTHLDISFNKIGNEGAKAIAESEHMRGLRWLNISSLKISYTAIEYLARYLPNTGLHIGYSHLSDDSLQDFKSRFGDRIELGSL